jgi:hypothetical protein
MNAGSLEILQRSIELINFDFWNKHTHTHTYTHLFVFLIKIHNYFID